MRKITVLGMCGCISAALYLAGTTTYFLAAGSLETKEACITGVLGFAGALCYAGLAYACWQKLRQPWFV